MTVTNLAVSQVVNLATVLNTKLEKPILTSEMGLDAQATLTKQAIRWDEWSLKHNNDGTFKTGIIASADIADGTIVTGDISATAAIVGTQLSATAAILGSQLSSTAGIVGGQLSTTAGILGTQLANHQNYNKSSISNPSATAATNGTAVALLPPTGFAQLSPLAMDVVFGGTFGTETVTASITVTFSDATTALLQKTATAVGTASLTNADLMTLSKDGFYINQISVVSQSSIASSTATVTFNHYGLYL